MIRPATFSPARKGGDRKLAIVGAGSWGTALAIVLAPRFEEIGLWVYEPELVAQIAATRENTVYLPGLRLPDHVCPGADLFRIVDGAEIVVGAMPSQHARGIYSALGPHLGPSATLVSATKGLEKASLLRMSEVILQTLPRPTPVAVLSGPTFAREVARGDPAAVVVASHDSAVARRVQVAFSGPVFRLYTSADPLGVEIGAALKNVIAIAAGVCRGLGLGNNTLAALITRGLAEITRVALAMGAEARTLAGLAGLGDLVLTCGGDLSRNRMVGIELAKGRPLTEIVGSMKMVAEGVDTCAAALALGEKFNVELPIIRQMDAVLNASKNPSEALRELMERSLKSE